MRDLPTAGIEVYLARRSARSAFMPDVYVFPGGALDEDDAGAGLALLDTPPEGVPPAYALAGLRELFEEAGILLAHRVDGTRLECGDLERLPGMRAKLVAGAPFAAVIAENGWRLDGSRLAYYSRWVTPLAEPRRFDARFFVARVPDDQEALADAVELHDGVWCTPQVAIERSAGNEFALAFPTRLHLERLASFARVADVEAAARARRPIPVMPVVDANGTIELPPEFAAW